MGRNFASAVIDGPSTASYGATSTLPDHHKKEKFGGRDIGIPGGFPKKTKHICF